MKVSTQSLQETLGSLVDGGVQLVTESDIVAGVQPYVVVAPGSEQEVASVLAYANRERLKVLVRGGGTQLNTGLPPKDGDILLSTRRLNQVVEYAPHDMTVTVQAGLKLVDLQSHLARARQWLALDPVLSPGATIGGIISTNVSGARRLRYGGIRDQIIGIRVVLPDGTIAKGGGKVVKNVAGYDLPKLFTGALGTLGVIVAATFRLYPLRAASRTVVLTAPTPAPLCDLAVRIITSTLEPTVLDIIRLRTSRLYMMTVRFEMEPESSDEQAAALVDMARAEVSSRPYSNIQTIQGEAEEQLWRQVAIDYTLASDTANALIVKASLLPTDVASWLESLEQMTQQANLTTRWRAHAGHGLIFAHLAGDEAALVTAIDQLRGAASAGQGSLVVVDAPPALASKVDVWGTLLGQTFEVMRRLKVRFDPNYTLNPGRFVGGM
ncbi:MAG: FAD-binding oxidoreductase [Ktedonobacteraceae bacterium]